jgi:protein-disulfide isomerase
MSPVRIPNTPWFAATLGLLGLILGYAVANGVGPLLPASGTTDTLPIFDDVPPPPQFDPPGIGDNEVLGQESAPITVIEFSSYTCPFCARHYTETFGLIKNEYIDQGLVKYVMRDFPLRHPYAQEAAESTECARDQGKFWEMHDALLANQQEWGSAPEDGISVFGCGMPAP